MYDSFIYSSFIFHFSRSDEKRSLQMNSVGNGKQRNRKISIIGRHDFKPIPKTVGKQLGANVTINVSGTIYETRNETLSKYPETLLGNKRKRNEYYCPVRKEYYFNRHRKSFDSILFFYQSPGILVRPQDIDFRVFIEECKFFQIPKWAIDFMKLKEHGELREFMDKMFKRKVNEDKSLRRRIWDILEHVDSSKHALRYAYTYTVLLFALIIVNSLATVESIRPKPKKFRWDAWIVFDFSINSFFLLEFILKLSISPNRLKFCKSMLTWIDFIAVIPFVVSLLQLRSHNWHHTPVLFLKPFQFFRIFRIFRIAKTSPGFRVTAITLRNSLDGVTLFIACLVVVVVFGGTIMYNLENVIENSDFSSIPESMWWAVETFVTLGYGDVVPKTAAGKLFASVFVISVIPTLSIPVMTVIATFTEYFACLNNIKDIFDDDYDDVTDNPTQVDAAALLHANNAMH